jgi:hypothetical protein
MRNLQILSSYIKTKIHACIYRYGPALLLLSMVLPSSNTFCLINSSHQQKSQLHFVSDASLFIFALTYDYVEIAEEPAKLYLVGLRYLLLRPFHLVRLIFRDGRFYWVFHHSANFTNQFSWFKNRQQFLCKLLM